VGAQNTRLENLQFLTEITIYLENEINENQIFPTRVFCAPADRVPLELGVGAKGQKTRVNGLDAFLMPADKLPMSNHWFSHIALFCLTATHATAV